MKLDSSQIRRYFEARLPDAKFRGNSARQMARCPFHQDSTASMSIDLDSGVFNCFGCSASGGYLAFEMKFSTCDEPTAWANIAELTGAQQQSISTQKPEAVYRYLDGEGTLLFEKLRYPGKRFAQRKPTEKGGWEYKLGDIRKPLYRLPEVLTSNLLANCEGEKDADNLNAAMKSVDLKGHRFCATTNFDGAGKWRDEYAPFFAGKRVVIFPDCDEVGRKHALTVANSVYPFASGVKIVEFPGLAEKGDVSDFLAAHGVDELLAVTRKTPAWHPERSGLFSPFHKFIATVPEQIDWLVEGVIERGANGFFCAAPKAGKSWSALDLALAISSGGKWLGFSVPHAVPVAIVSREDNPALTAWRLRQMAMARGIVYDDAKLYINTRQQSSELMLDSQEQVNELLTALRQLKPEFVLFDVFNVMHAAEENDNTEMRTVLRQLSSIQSEIHCSVGVVHHFNKNDSGSMTQRLRGSSAIAGWAEWLVGISVADDEQKIRRMEFELKAAMPPDPVHFKITSDASGSRLEKVDHAPDEERRNTRGPWKIER